MKGDRVILMCIFIGLVILKEANCLRKRCIRCRSRGDLGSCADPFLYNVTQLETEVAVHVEECPSGWCGKIFEGTTGAFRLDDFGEATQRLCLQRPPSDYEERCAYTLWSHRKVYMCFCNGDLCNAATRTTNTSNFLTISLILVFVNYWYNL